MSYVLQDLPSVSRVEVMRLARKHQHPGIVRDLDCIQGVEVEGETALEIAHLWRQLPFTEQMRCHNPPFALRFFSGDGLILTASLCWHCNNILIMENGQSKGAKFDGGADVSRQLFRLLDSVAPKASIFHRMFNQPHSTIGNEGD